MNKKCSKCGVIKPVTEFARNYKSGKIRSDCKECFNKDQRIRYSKGTCIDCGSQCCSTSKRCRPCANKFKSITYRGDKLPNWKGGTTQREGYKLISIPGHLRAHKHSNYVMEHIVIWEKANGKPLPKGWIIHHLNGIKTDNRISNLQALPSKKHYLLISAKAKRIQELEALLKGQGLLC